MRAGLGGGLDEVRVAVGDVDGDVGVIEEGEVFPGHGDAAVADGSGAPEDDEARGAEGGLVGVPLGEPAADGGGLCLAGEFEGVLDEGVGDGGLIGVDEEIGDGGASIIVLDDGVTEDAITLFRDADGEGAGTRICVAPVEEGNGSLEREVEGGDGVGAELGEAGIEGIDGADGVVALGGGVGAAASEREEAGCGGGELAEDEPQLRAERLTEGDPAGDAERTDEGSDGISELAGAAELISGVNDDGVRAVVEAEVVPVIEVSDHDLTDGAADAPALQLWFHGGIDEVDEAFRLAVHEDAAGEHDTNSNETAIKFGSERGREAGERTIHLPEQVIFGWDGQAAARPAIEGSLEEGARLFDKLGGDFVALDDPGGDAFGHKRS